MEGGPVKMSGPPLTVWPMAGVTEGTRWRKQYLHGWGKAGGSSSPTFV